MKAICAATTEDYTLVTRPMPDPAADEVLVKVAAEGLCPNEARLRAGGLRAVSYPVIPGHQFSGTV